MVTNAVTASRQKTEAPLVALFVTTRKAWATIRRRQARRNGDCSGRSLFSTTIGEIDLMEDLESLHAKELPVPCAVHRHEFGPSIVRAVLVHGSHGAMVLFCFKRTLPDHVSCTVDLVGPLSVKIKK